MQRFNAILMF